LHVLNKSGAPGSLSVKEFAQGAGQAPDIVAPWSRDISMGAKFGFRNKPEVWSFDRALSPILARVAGVTAAAGQSPFKW